MAILFFFIGYLYRKTNNTNESKNMKKKLIRLTEGDLRRIVKESVNRALNEMDYSNNPLGNYAEQFDYCGEFNDNGLALVELNRMYNFIDQDGEILSDEWFKGFNEGFAVVRRGDKYNFIDREGYLLSNQWFDYCSNFHNGFAEAELHGKTFRIDTNGRIC